MNVKFNLDADKLLEHKFNGNTLGYDAREVDEFLDLILADYRNFSKLEKEYDRLINKMDSLMNKNLNVEALNVQLKKRNEEMTRVINRKETTIENLMKIDAYERKLWALGVDPSKLT